MSSDNVLKIDVWWRPGNGMIYNRYHLEHNHPEHIYNYIKSLGYVPEDYGINHPLTERFKEYSRSELIAMIADLENELHSKHFYGY